MATHDRYDTDVLKQLTKIANNLDKIVRCLEPKTPNISVDGNCLDIVAEEYGIKPTGKLWKDIFNILMYHSEHRSTMCDTSDIPTWLEEEYRLFDWWCSNIMTPQEYGKEHPEWVEKIKKLASGGVDNDD